MSDKTRQIIKFQAVLLDLARCDLSRFDEALSRLLETDAETLGVSRVSLWFFDSPRTEIVCQSLYRLDDGVFEKGMRLKAARYPAYFKALEESRTIAADDALADPRTSEFSEDYLKPLGISSMMDVPVRRAGSVVGTVCHEHTGPGRSWSREEQDFAASIADLVSLAMEASERAAAEEATAKALSLLKATLDSTTDGILVVDTFGKIVSFNSRFVQLWRIPQDIIGSRDDDQALSFVVGQLKDPEGFLKKVRELYGKPAEESFDILEFQDGRVFERMSRPQVLGQRIVGRVWSFRDVTDRVRSEEADKRKSEELARSNKELRQFASIVAHDIQEPLRTIEAFAERLAKMTEGRLDKKESEYLARIRNAALRMGQFTQDLLVYSKVSTRDKKLELVDLNEILREVMQDLERLIVEAGIRVDAGPLPVLHADRTQMRQLFQNLLSNAVKFTQKVAQPHVVIRSWSREGRAAGFFIADNGIGFEPEYADRIFEPFQRLHDREDYPGSGMGLAVCRKIVERHNGTITAQGEVGEGATFTVVLPV